MKSFQKEIVLNAPKNQKIEILTLLNVCEGPPEDAFNRVSKIWSSYRESFSAEGIVVIRQRSNIIYRAKMYKEL